MPEPENVERQKEYYSKESHLSSRLQKEVMRDGTAYIPCRVEGIDDIISKFSVEGCESLDAEFADYLLGFADYIPKGCPIVLEVHGASFTEEEKALIVDVVTSEMDYLLGKAEEESKRHKKVFWAMATGTVGSGIVLAAIKNFIDDVPLEFFYVIFWLFADELVRYLFVENYDNRDERIRAGRLASMTVEFVNEPR